MGFCRGGRTVWVYSANNANLKAGVAYYGSLVDTEGQKALWPKSATELAPEMKAPVLGLYGEADAGIPVAQVDQKGRDAEERRVQPLSRCAARLPRRLPAELPQGSRR